jgi:hypothetical protein
VAAGDANVQWELQKRFRARLDRTSPPATVSRRPQRSLGEILAARDERVRQRRRRLAQERARKQREKAAARKAYLDGLGPREDALRDEISTLLGTTQQKNYDQAVAILVDLRDAAALHGRDEAFDEYLTSLRTEHAKKVSLLRRFDQAGL